MSPTDTLVAVPNATLISSSLSPSGTETTLTGQLALESVTFDTHPTPSATGAAVQQGHLLVLVLRTGTGIKDVVAFEAPLGPTRTFTVSSLRSRRRYVFHATRDDAEFTVELPVANDDVELFHSVLEGFVAELGGRGKVQSRSAPASPARGLVEETTGPEGEDDLRGRFVLMNEDDGEIVGTLDKSVKVHEDQSLTEEGHEKDPIVVEVPDTVDGLKDEEVLVRTIPPEERDWILKGAFFFCNAISGTTTRLTRGMTTASNSYIARSTPSSPSTATATPGPNTPSPSSPSSGPVPPPGPPPSRRPTILQSPSAQGHLSRLHALSSGAVNLSNRAAAAAGSLTQHNVGTGGSGVKGKVLAAVINPPRLTPPPLPPRNRRSSSAPTTPTDNKPPLPPRPSESPPTPSSPGPSVQSPGPQPQSPTTPRSTRTSLALSAALILASLETSAGRLVEAGGAAVSAAVKHKYGPGAVENAALVGRAARNIVLVYVDVRGLCRPVAVKRMTKSWVKEQIAAAQRR